ncbi:MAG: SDR family oxidoreductase [Nitrospira sp.]|nr:SDR family oxidoreductase [Nitrospira sp.]MBX3369202.1 SDR family oxidoreductase [Nitrospira sp.]
MKAQRHHHPRVVVITGASAGVGRATVREFAREGAWIGLVARSRDGLEGARKEVEAAGGRALVLPTDVAYPDQVEAAAAMVERRFGPIDVWVNNAMASVLSPALKMTAEEYQRVTDVTYLGYVYGTLAALRRMVPRDAGVIVQVGSALAYRSIPLQSAYCGAKHAVQGFVDSLRSELLHDGSRVHITTVQLPAVNTPQFDWIKSRMPCHPQPVPPIYQPEVIARAIVWASRHRRREISIGLPTVKAIVGQKFIPGLLDYYLAWKGYKAQQTNEPIAPDRPNNLFHPLPGDHGAHGGFDEGAYAFSLQLWLNQRRLWVAAAALAVGGYLASSVSTRRNERRLDGEPFSPTGGTTGSARVQAARQGGLYA